LFHLRRDPFERADTDSNGYNTWWEENTAWLSYGSAKALMFAQTFRQFPARQAPNSFTVDGVVKQLTTYHPKVGEAASAGAMGAALSK